MFFSFHCIKGFSHCNISEKKSKIWSPKQVNQHDFSLQSWCNFFKLFIVYFWNSSVKLACVEIAAKTLLPSISWTLYPWPRLKEPQKLLGLCAESFSTIKNCRIRGATKIQFEILSDTHSSTNLTELITMRTSSQHDQFYQPSPFTKHPHIIHHLRSARQLWARIGKHEANGILTTGIHMMNICKYPPGNTHLSHQTRKRIIIDWKV